MPDTHHNFSPSTLQRLSLCPGSFRMSDGLPEQKTEHAEEGTMLHKVLSEDLPNEGLTEEQSELINQCDAFWTGLVQPEDLVCVKEKPLKVMDGENVLTEGTADVVIVHSNNTSDVIDWKFGRNPAPEANHNYQLAAYALGVFQEYGVAEVTAHIYQPRLYHHSEYTFRNPENILSNIESIIRKATAPELVLNPGESQCRYCPAKSICPAFSAAFSALAVESESRDLSNPAVLLDWWNKAQVVEKMVKELKDRVTDYCREHGTLGDWQLVERAGKREITNSVELCTRLNSYITAAEWRQCNTVNLGKLTDLLVEKLKASASASGEKLTIKAAKEKVEALVGDLIVRGEPTSVLTRKGKK